MAKPLMLLTSFWGSRVFTFMGRKKYMKNFLGSSKNEGIFELFGGKSLEKSKNQRFSENPFLNFSKWRF